MTTFRHKLYPQYKAKRDSRMKSKCLVIETNGGWSATFIVIQSSKILITKYTQQYKITTGEHEQYHRALSFFQAVRDAYRFAEESNYRQPLIVCRSPNGEPTPLENQHAYADSRLSKYEKAT